MFRILSSLLYPSVCAGCGQPSEVLFCEACRVRMPLREKTSHCLLCGKLLLARETAQGSTAPLCAGCRAHPPAFDRACSALLYKDPARNLIHAVKYHREPWVSEVLSEYLEGAMRAYYGAERIDFMIPVPLHFSRLFGRGYNQAECLAAALARRVSLPLCTCVLRRVRKTPTQTRMNAESRAQNMKSAFRVPARALAQVYGKTILLVDDVMTTGSTFQAAAEALRAAGAGRILCLSVARD